MAKSKEIIVLTTAAEKHIRTIMARRGGGLGFRIAVKKTGCSGYMYQPAIVDRQKIDDVALTTQDGLNIFIDPDCVAILKGTLLDYVKKDLGQYQLQFNNPNVVGACGCGESFHLKEDEHDEA